MSPFIALLLIVAVRNLLVMYVMLRRIDEVYRRNICAINEGREPAAYPKAWPSQLWLIADLRKWTYRQFFPEALQ